MKFADLSPEEKAIFIKRLKNQGLSEEDNQAPVEPPMPAQILAFPKK